MSPIKKKSNQANTSSNVSPSLLDTSSPVQADNVTFAFKLIEEIAGGAYGVVFKAMKCKIITKIEKNPDSIITINDLEETGEMIAVKISFGDLCSSGIQSISEIDILGRLRHPYLLSMHQISLVEFNDTIVTKYGNISKTSMAISMPWAKYGNLRDFIKNNNVSFEEKVMILRQILLAIRFMHAQRVLHMDIKQENVLVMGRDPLNIKVCDFGMATYSNPNGNVIFDQEAVTITYRSPELLDNKQFYSRANDVWSIGMLFLYMLIEKEHIYPHIKPISKVKTFLRTNFNNMNRRTVLYSYLDKINIDNVKRKLAVDFIDRALNYYQTKRPGANELLMDPIFNIIQTKLKEDMNKLYCNFDSYPNGGTIFRNIWKQPVDKITVEVYRAIDFIIRLSNSFNCKVETFFLAMDLFNRGLAYIYSLHDYYKHKPELWLFGCKIGEVVSLGALVCLWIAQKAIEDTMMDVNTIYVSSSRYYDKSLIIDMERQLIINLDGIIYQWNPFMNCSDENDLIREFGKITNIFDYQQYNVKDCAVKYSNQPYALNFRDIYHKTEYYKQAPKLTSEIPQFTKQLFEKHRSKYINHITPTPVFNCSK